MFKNLHFIEGILTEEFPNTPMKISWVLSKKSTSEIYIACSPFITFLARRTVLRYFSSSTSYTIKIENTMPARAWQIILRYQVQVLVLVHLYMYFVAYRVKFKYETLIRASRKANWIFASWRKRDTILTLGNAPSSTSVIFVGGAVVEAYSWNCII